MNNYKNKNWKAYISYYGDNIVNDFNLKESENVKLYNIKKNNGINHLHYHYANLVCAYYIWKNQIKSNYVCIWDHRRFITPINFDKLDNDMIQTYYHGYTELTPFEYMIKDGINEYIIYQFVKYMIEIKHINHDIIINKIYNEPWLDHIWYHSCFNCNWKVFNDLCEFIFGFVSYMMPIGNYDKQYDCDEFIKDLQRSFNIIESKYKDGEMFSNWGRIKSGDRSIASLYELILPLYCDLVWNGTFHEVEDKHIALELYDFNKDTVVADIKRWISKNIFTGCRDFAIITSLDKYNELYNIINDNYNWYYMSNNLINIINENDTYTISNYNVLNINEFIDSDKLS